MSITCNQGTEWQHCWAQAGKVSACAGPEPAVVLAIIMVITGSATFIISALMMDRHLAKFCVCNGKHK